MMYDIHATSADLWDAIDQLWCHFNRSLRRREITFNRDAPKTAGDAKLVRGQAGVNTGIHFGRVPDPQITVLQDGNPEEGKYLFLLDLLLRYIPAFLSCIIQNREAALVHKHSTTACRCLP